MTRRPPSAPELQTLHTYYDQADAPDPRTLTGIRHDVLTRLAARPTRARTRRIAVVNVTAAITVIVGAVAVASVVAPTGQPVVAPTGQPPDASATVALADSLDGPATLRLLADHTGNAPALVLGRHQFVYTYTRLSTVGKVAVGRPIGSDIAYFRHYLVTELWASAESLASVRWKVTKYLDPRPLTRADAEKLKGHRFPKVIANDSKVPGPAGERPEPGPYNPTPAYLASLPTDPDQLLDALRDPPHPEKPDPGGQQAAQKIFDRVAYLVQRADAILTPQLRTALYQALATLPGVKRIPGRTDLEGRSGVAIGLTDDCSETQLILDPTTSRVLGVREIVVGCAKGLAQGTVVAHSTTDQRIVGSVTATS